MQKRIANLIPFIIAVFIVACEPIEPLPVTPTPDAPEPTPTQEYNYWDTSCLEDGSEPINTNPCLSGNPPYDVEFIVAPNANNSGTTTTPELHDGKWRLWLAGQKGEGFAGFVGLRIDNLALSPGECYGYNFEVTELDLGETPKGEMDNITAEIWIHLDNGEPPILLARHAVTIPYGFNFIVDPDPDWFAVFHVTEPMTVVLDAGINQVWANARMGNHVDIDYLYLHVVDWSLCEDIAVLE